MIIETKMGMVEVTRDGTYSIARALNGTRSWVLTGPVAWHSTSEFLLTPTRILEHTDEGFADCPEKCRALSDVVLGHGLKLNAVHCVRMRDELVVIADRCVYSIKAATIARMPNQPNAGEFGQLDSGQLYWSCKTPRDTLSYVYDGEWIGPIAIPDADKLVYATRTSHLICPKSRVIHQLCLPFYIGVEKAVSRLYYGDVEYTRSDGSSLTICGRDYLERHDGEVWLRQKDPAPLGMLCEPFLLMPPSDYEKAEEEFKKAKTCV